MKKAIFAALAALPLVLAGCSDSSNSSEEPTTSAGGSTALEISGDSVSREYSNSDPVTAKVNVGVFTLDLVNSEFRFLPGSRVEFLQLSADNSIIRVCEDVDILDGDGQATNSTAYIPEGSSDGEILVSSSVNSQDIEYTPPCGY